MALILGLCYAGRPQDYMAGEEDIKGREHGNIVPPMMATTGDMVIIIIIILILRMTTAADHHFHVSGNQ